MKIQPALLAFALTVLPASSELAVDPETALRTGSVNGYPIQPAANLSGANLSGANLSGAILKQLS